MFITDKMKICELMYENRKWQGIPSVEVTRNGRLFITFYSGGETEEPGNYCVLLQSDDGVTFGEPIAVVYAGKEARCFDPCLWMDPRGRLWFTWAVKPEGNVYYTICEYPDAPVLAWSEPGILGQEVMMNKPIATSWGEWLFPVAVWSLEENRKSRLEKYSFVYATSDNGEHFYKIGKADVAERHYDEHMLIELMDGTLEMYVRTRYGIGKSVSYDKGRSWSDGMDSGLGGPNSRFHIRRLPSGNLLCINHAGNSERDRLCAILSQDDGITWGSPLMLDDRDQVSYPDAAVGEDGFIYIVYDRERGARYKPDKDYSQDAREVLMAKITEADINAGELVEPRSFLRKIISKI